jgi:hypothetical protein
MDKSIENNPMNHDIFAGHSEMTSRVPKKFDCRLLKKVRIVRIWLITYGI